MIGISINPGSGPVANAKEAYATENIEAFIRDCSGDGIKWRRKPESDENGRFTFVLYKDGTDRTHEIDMPGLPLDRVRFMEEPGQNPWNFPRLFVDGSSWFWMFAILNGKDDWKPFDEVEE